MASSLSTYYVRFHIWRVKHLSKDYFVSILSVIIGILSAFAAFLFKTLVHDIRHLLTIGIFKEYGQYAQLAYVVLPIIGIILTVLFLKFILKRRLGHGVPNVLYSISRNAARLKPSNMYASIVASALTIGFGGSAGVEGPAAATGSALGSNVASFFRLKYKDRVLLLGAGAAAAIAAIFKAPITGIVFVIEILMLDLKFRSLIPLLLASSSATITSYFLLGKDVIYSVSVVYRFPFHDIPWFLLLGIISGFISLYYFKTYVYVHQFFEEKIPSRINKLLIGGILLGGFVFLFPSIYGEGFTVINHLLHNQYNFIFKHAFLSPSSHYDVLFFLVFIGIILAKAIATSLTFVAGGIGGDFAPALFIGANVGTVFALFSNYYLHTNLNPIVFTLVGMAASISGILHAPLTAIFLIAEITGNYTLFVPLMLVSALSFFTIRLFSKESIYTFRLSKRGELVTHDKDQSAINMIEINKLIETNFKKIKLHDSLGEIVKAFEQSKRNLFPIVNDDNQFEGLVFLDDIRKTMCHREFWDTIKAEDVILRFEKDEIIEITKDTPQTIINKFLFTGNYNLPVVKNGRYLGFISRANVFTQYRKLVKLLATD